MVNRSIDELTIKDNFMFGAVMRNPKRFKALLECVLDIKIKEIKYPELEKTIDKSVRAKSIRLDVYVEDDYNTIYNIEMQATNKRNLPKRTRYYQGIIDLNIIDKGMDYTALKKSYVIFICDYDEFGLGRHIYTFEKICKEVPDLVLGDDTVVVVLNIKGTLDDINDETKELLEYIGGAKPKSELTMMLEDEVERVRSNVEWGREFMTMQMLINETKALGQCKILVSQIRDLDINEIDMASHFLKVDKDYILYVKNVIKENPNLDDDDIAEMILEF